MKLNEYLILNNVISPFQSGFQRGDSTVNQLLLMNHEFSKALDENKETRIVFCDISRVFDRVWLLVQSLSCHQLSQIGILIDLIVSNSPTLKSFKRQLNQTRNETPYPKYFDIFHTSRSGQIYHSRLRLECSSLKHHLYTKTLLKIHRVHVVQ